jgi:hypothetical protein
MRPNTYGEPVAFLAVPRAEVDADAEPVVELDDALDAPFELLELLELLPQPAASNAAAATAAATLPRLRIVVIVCGSPSCGLIAAQAACPPPRRGSWR